MQQGIEKIDVSEAVTSKSLNFVGIAYPEDYSFNFEESLPESYLLRKDKNAIDLNYRINRATREARVGQNEPVYTEKAVVCKHWLRGLCKKGDLCEFLHEYNLERIPECWFYTKYGECSNPECMYLHLEQGSKVKYCIIYDKGFCPNGPKCKDRHLKRAICKMYLEGFCPNGPKCNNAHPKCVITEPKDFPKQQLNYFNLFEQSKLQKPIPTSMEPFLPILEGMGPMPPLDNARGKVYRPLGSVTCFKCGMKGHYANRCSKRARIYPTETSLPM